LLLTLVACYQPGVKNKATQIPSTNQYETFSRARAVLIAEGYFIHFSERESGVLTTKIRELSDTAKCGLLDCWVRQEVTILIRYESASLFVHRELKEPSSPDWFEVNTPAQIEDVQAEQERLVRLVNQ